MDISLVPRKSPGANVTGDERNWILSIPAGGRGSYRLAQLDDYASLPRDRFRWSPPLTLRLRARVSAPGLPGTWGFGLWNDPFGLSLGFGATAGRLPTLPASAWFFHASPPNHLSLRDDNPAQGYFAGTMSSPRWPPFLLVTGLLALPFLVLRPVSRLLRRLVGKIVLQAVAGVDVDVTQWHEYAIRWQREQTSYDVDGKTTLQTTLSPRPPLGLVIWIDNQFAAWKPDGRLGYGTLENPPAWLEIQDLVMHSPDRN